MYLGTGESETALIVYRESSGRGNGLYCSTDGGKQWDLMPSTAQWAYVTDVEVRVENGQSVIYAGVVSGYYKGAYFVRMQSQGQIGTRQLILLTDNRLKNKKRDN